MKNRSDLLADGVYRSRQFSLILLGLAFVVYASVFIYRTSLVLDTPTGGLRAFTLFDDAMISMRYGRNLAEGHGLVWNPGGERVEGYTNPGWVLLMAAAHKLPIGPFKVSLVIQIAAVFFLLINIFLTHAVGRWAMPRAPAVALAAAVFTALYYPLNYWGITGMEVSLCVLLTMTAVFLVSRGLDLTALLLLGTGTWLRTDTAVIFMAVWAYCVLFRAGRRRLLLVVPGIVLAVALGSQTAWRMWYYGDPLPNTYYLKMTGFPAGLRILRGAVRGAYFILRSSWPLLLCGALLMFRRPWTAYRLPKVSLKSLSETPHVVRAMVLLVVCFGAQAAYSVYVGGDAWETMIACNRFISIVIPAYFILYAAGLYGVCSRLAPARQRMIFAAMVLISLLNFNTFPRRENLAQWLLVDRPVFSEVNAENVRLALEIKRITTPEAVVALDLAGTVPYFAGRTCIDLLGKCDTVVGRGPMHRYVMTRNPLLEFYPGHLKWNYAYSIGKLRPDLVTARWGKDKGDSDAFLYPDYAEVRLAGLKAWLLRDSPHIRFSAL